MPHFGIIPAQLKDDIVSDGATVLRQLRQLGYQYIESIYDRACCRDPDCPKVSGLSLNWDDLPGCWAYMQDGVAWDPSEMQASVDASAQAARAVGAEYVVLYWGPAESRAQLQRLARVLEAVGARLAEHDLRFCYHNHDHEFTTVFDGVRAHDLLVAATDPATVYFQLDLGWVRYGGEDPVSCIRRLAGRVPTVHVRDVCDPNTRGAFAIPGTGILDMAAIWQACAETGVQWIIFEPHKVVGMSAMEVNAAAALNLRSLGVIAAGISADCSQSVV